jgi:hypothetical protein
MTAIIHEATVAQLALRIAFANKRYGDSFASTQEGLGVILEEFDEVKAAIHANDLDQVQHECIDLAACCIRLAQALETETTRNRSVK